MIAPDDADTIALEPHEVLMRLHKSFMVAREARPGMTVAAMTEFSAVTEWAAETMARYLLVQAVVKGEVILELDGDRPYGREPTAAERARLKQLGVHA
jgi:hypothetical protein